MSFNYKWKNLTRTDLIQYDGEKFINVPAYSVRDKVRWEKEEVEQANLRINNSIKTVALLGHKHQISDIENLQNILNDLNNFSSTSNSFSIAGANDINLTEIAVDNLLKYNGTQWVNVPMSSLEVGTKSSWGTTSDNYSILSVDDIEKTVALQGHTHNYLPLTGGTLTGNLTAPLFIGDLSGSATNLSRSILAGNGLTGGGALSADRTLTLGTPSNITLSSTNSVGTSSHTHALIIGGTTSQYLRGTGVLVDIPSLIAGNGLTGGGQWLADRGLSLGTPSTLTSATTNNVTTSSHTHAITTTTVGSANTIVATDANGGVRGNIIRIGSNWTLELSGTELLFKYGGVVKQRMFQDGSFSATGEVSAYSQGTAADELQLNKLTLLQGGGISKYLSSTATQIYFDIDGATPLSMTKTEVRRGTSNNNVNLGTSAYPWANIYGVNLIASTDISTPKITLGNGWTIEQTSASLTIRRNGVVKGTFDA